MLVKDIINNTELDLTADEIMDQVANHDRQVYLIFDQVRTDEDGYMKWDKENWTSVDGKRFIRSYFLEDRALSEYSGFNVYDFKSVFVPEEAKEVQLA